MYAFWKSGHAIIALQVAVILGGLLVLAFDPPTHGKMILLPLDHSAATALTRRAIDGDALLIGPGPLRGSMVVNADYAAMRRATSGLPVLIIAAPPAGCFAAGTTA
ncbi:hypothetical protein GCM10023219_09860 [Stakelama sediminis]|uniref:Uncharacterized protein n=1 Tax=Stakelama sediminis TaxID=463200 RepID=A0A840YVN3_9SPHN|nr:hypothetical protein [Stakelama sediminis]MBB5717708.1 hypothetical protein [Stakelama sediminis]